MRLGTPGFVGDRLREAREVRGLQAVMLAEMAGVSPQAISQYENDHSSPSPDVCSRLAQILGVQEHFFVLPARRSDTRIFFRSQASTTKTARMRARRRLRWLDDLVDFVSTDVELPSANFPALDIPSNHNQISADDIEQAASDARRYWGMRDGPVFNMVSLLENQGAIVIRDTLGAETLDSLCEFEADSIRPLVVIGVDKGTSVRWRYDVAHELGHILLHRNIDRRTLSNKTEHKTIETQAHRFAGAFLLPLSTFSEDFFAASLDAMRTMKPKWKTSVAAMIMRAKQTDLISDDATSRLFATYNRRGWRRNEPLDDQIETEEPVVLRRAFDLLSAKHGDDAIYAAAAQTGISATDVTALVGGVPREATLAGPSVLPREAGSNVFRLHR